MIVCVDKLHAEIAKLKGILSEQVGVYLGAIAILKAAQSTTGVMNIKEPIISLQLVKRGYTCDYMYGVSHCNISASLYYTYNSDGRLIFFARCKDHPMTNGPLNPMKQVTLDELENLREASRVHEI